MLLRHLYGPVVILSDNGRIHPGASNPGSRGAPVHVVGAQMGHSTDIGEAHCTRAEAVVTAFYGMKHSPLLPPPVPCLARLHELT